MFFDNLTKLCEEHGIKPTPLVKSLGMSSGSIKNWKEGKLPSGESLMRFSEYFNVSIDYLLTGEEKSNDKSNYLSSEDRELLKMIHELPADVRAEIKGEIKGYLKRMREESASDGLRDVSGK